jgi:hypothetical protein
MRKNADLLFVRRDINCALRDGAGRCLAALLGRFLPRLGPHRQTCGLFFGDYILDAPEGGAGGLGSTEGVCRQR